MESEHQPETRRERWVPILRAAALIGAIIALVAVVAPRLASSRGSQPTPTTVASAPADSSTTALTIRLPSTTEAPTAASSPTTTSPPTENATAPTTTEPLVQDGGAVSLTLVGLEPNGVVNASIVDGDSLVWHFRVTNSGEQYLWGVYVYLELRGWVPCDDHRLEIGASTDCWVQSIAWAGQDNAEAWVTAWTETHRVEDIMSYDYAVLPG
jgi:hypothetical protein